MRRKHSARPENVKIGLIDGIIVFILAVFYGAWAFDGLAQQGIYCDIGLLGKMALVPIKKIVMEGPYFLTFGGRSWPLMLLDYHGPAEIYFAIPWIILFGHTAFSLHVGTAVLGGVTIPIFYLLQVMFYRSRAIAVMNSTLLFTSVSYVAACRLGLYTGTLVIFLALASTLCFFLWEKTRGFFWLLSAFIFIGLGLGSRIFFLWFVVGAGAFALRHEFHKKLGLLSRLQRILCVASLFLGVAPILIANIQEPFLSLRFLVKHSIVSSDGISNLNYLANIAERLRHLALLLSGEAYSNAGNLANMWFVAVAWVVYLALLWGARWGKIALGKEIRWPLWVCGIVLLLSPVTPSGLQALHLFVIYPFLYSIPGLLVELSPVRFRRLAAAAVFAASLATVGGNITAIYAQGANRNLHGGYEVHWNVLGDVADWLKESRIKTLGIGDTGIVDALQFLTGFEVRTDEVFWAPYLKVPQEDREAILNERLEREKTGFYLFRASGLHWVDYFPRFREIASATGKNVVVEKDFKTPDGQVLFVIYRLESASQRLSSIEKRKFH